LAGLEELPQIEASDTMSIDDLLRFMVRQGASDLHLKPMRPPLLRVHGKLLPLKGDPLHPDLLREMLSSLLNERMKDSLADRFSVDFGHSVPGVSRFRATVFHQRGTLSAVFRRVPFEFPSLEDWGLPPVIAEFAKLGQGLVILTGPTGSGKSSTLAALMRLIVNTRLCHVVTIEDPIEFLLRDNLGAVTQREVGTDTPSFSEALRNAMRQDPDVIMVGEMRDLETMQTVLTAAETGHLVFSTLHTNSAAQTVDRIVDLFPEGMHRQVRQQLATVLQGVVSMRLVERADGQGLIAAVEILRHSPRVAKLIHEGNLEALEEEIENSVSYYRMQSMNQSLAALVIHGAITKEAAQAASSRPGDLDLMLRKMLYAAEHGAEPEGEAMAEPLGDFSKIVELQEIRKLYDEMQERTGREFREKDQEIARLREELRARSDTSAGAGAQVEQLRAEVDRLNRQIQMIRQEYEARLERVNARVKELTASGPVAAGAPHEPDRKGGFFRR
jgi:twitching motility protein PilT